MANRYLKLILVIHLIVALLAPALLPGRASAQENDPGGWSGEAPPQAGSFGLSPTVPGASRLAYHEQTGLLSFMGTKPGEAIPQPQVLPPDTSAETAALSFLGVYGAMFGLNDPANELATLSVQGGENGHAYVRFQQTYQGAPVMGGELIVQMDGKQDVVSVNGEVLPGEASIATTPTVAADAAVAAAKAAVAKEYSLAQETLSGERAGAVDLQPGYPRLSRRPDRPPGVAHGSDPCRPAAGARASAGGRAERRRRFKHQPDRQRQGHGRSITTKTITPEGFPAAGALSATKADRQRGSRMSIAPMIIPGLPMISTPARMGGIAWMGWD